MRSHMQNVDWGWGCTLGRGSYVAKAQRPERGAMLTWNMGVRKGKVSLRNIADEGPVGT